MIAKLEKISDRTYRLVAGILYVVLAIFTLYASFSRYTRISMWSFSDLGPLGVITLIGYILLAVGILFRMSELVLGGIIANIALWVLKLIIMLRYRLYVPSLIYRILIIALFVFALMTLAGKSTKSFQRIAIYIRLFCFVLTLFPLYVPHSFFSLFSEYLYPFIETIAFISLLMLIYRGSICMPKKTAISQHTKSNNVSNKIETLSNLKDNHLTNMQKDIWILL